MKKIILGIIVMAISLGFTACGEAGGTLKLINDTTSPYYFSIYFNGEKVKVNNGAIIIHPSQTIQAVSYTDTSYVVYGDVSVAVYNSKTLGTGSLSGGETKELKFSTVIK